MKIAINYKSSDLHRIIRQCGLAYRYNGSSQSHQTYFFHKDDNQESDDGTSKPEEKPNRAGVRHPPPRRSGVRIHPPSPAPPQPAPGIQAPHIIPIPFGEEHVPFDVPVPDIVGKPGCQRIMQRGSTAFVSTNPWCHMRNRNTYYSKLQYEQLLWTEDAYADKIWLYNKFT